MTEKVDQIEAIDPTTGEKASVTTIHSAPRPDLAKLRLGDTAILHGPVHWISPNGEYAHISLPSFGEVQVLVSDIFEVIPRPRTPEEEIEFLREENNGLRRDVAAAERAYDKLIAERSPIPHDGGPRPVAEHYEVIVRFRSGSVMSGPAINFRWSHLHQHDDIVAYLIASDVMRIATAKR